MTIHALTTEQEQVIHHPIGRHARVLAVAGSGKSSTLAHRIKHLVQGHGIRPSSIQVLMFNSLARKQFVAYLNSVGLPEALQPSVHTFHSFSYQVINQMIKAGALPPSTQFWLADKAELIWLTVKRAITALEKSRRIPPEAVDPEEALLSISLWKGSLIPPKRAGSTLSNYLPLIYQEFEAARLKANALTFDDFVPLAVELIEENLAVGAHHPYNLAHLIVDEYQDINYGQQRLIELLAGDQADIMVVGDDDQTIYEWRGARPNYILKDFLKVFNDKEVIDYRLSRSFRFGPFIAQCAANVIANNTARLDKPLIAHQLAKPGFIQFLHGYDDSARQLTDEIQAMVELDKVPPPQIIVMARMFAQLDGLEAEFLSRRIPYRVEGQEPFFKRQEIKALLDYLRLGKDFQEITTEQHSSWLLNVANKPSRMLTRSLLSRMVDTARYRKLTVREMLEAALYDPAFGLNAFQAEKVANLGGFIEMLHHRLRDPGILAGNLLEWMVQTLNYLTYFQDYYGKGEHADEKKYAVLNFIRYVTMLQLSPVGLLDHLARLDTTQGKPEDELIIFTTIYRTKGLEYDYVILPQCDDNIFPYLKGDVAAIFDKKNLVNMVELSSKLDSERRLFYVALTRARKGVLIGVTSNPSRFVDEMQAASADVAMKTVQALASKEPNADGALRQLLQANHFSPALISNLVTGYLPDLGLEAVAKQLQQTHSAVSPTVGK